MIEMHEFIAMEKKKQKGTIKGIRKNVTYMSPKELAAHIKLHYVTTLRLIEQGKFEGAIKVGGRWRVPVET